MKWLKKLFGIRETAIPMFENPPPIPEIRHRIPDFKVGDKVTIGYLFESDEGVIAGEPYFSSFMPGMTSPDWRVPVRNIAGKISNPPCYLVHKIKL